MLKGNEMFDANKKKWIMGPVAAAVLVALAGCDNDTSTPDTGATDPVVPPPAMENISLKVNGISFPASEVDKLVIRGIDSVTVNGEHQEVAYAKLMATGYQDPITKEVFGLVKDLQDQPIKFEDDSNYICNGTNDGVGSGLDYTSILQKDGKLHMVAQFECQVGALYTAELSQDDQGNLSPVEGTLEFISQKDEFGGWVHCAGQATPWQSHLASEEYEPDARFVEESFDADTGLTGDAYYNEVAKFWGEDLTKANPYYYGWSPEVDFDADGNPTYAKHYAMGRFSHELSYVMPDERTVYLSDDGTNVGLFMYVADTAGDLSAGTLYAVKWEQTSADNGGAANLSWVDLGHADNAAVREWVAKGLSFSDIFDTADGTDLGDGTVDCGAEFTSINASAGQECLRLKDINADGAVDSTDEMIASRLETRRFAAMKGATTEFRKEEGITFNQRDGKLYVAMSAIERGMEDFAKNGADNDKYDIGGGNHIKVGSNKCGGVYELNVAADEAIDSDFVAKDMAGLVLGTERDYTGTQYEGNRCDIAGISNPDNVSYLENSNVLVIGEDTGKHENNVIWAYDLEEKTLERMVTTPLDAETTSPFWYKDINGFGYMTAVTQHPLGGEDVSDAEKESQVGYIGPFKFPKGE